MTNRAIAEKGHGAVGDLAEGLDFGPPDAAVTDTDAIDVQAFWDDDVIDPGLRKEALVGEVSNAGKAARLLIDRSRNLDRTLERNAFGEDRLHSDHRSRDARLHVAGATPVNAVVANDAAKGIFAPAEPGVDHIDMAVEMHSRPWRPPFQASDHIGARIPVAISDLPFRTDIRHIETVFR